ncbi:MAG TPA: beta-lactamase family protein [Candidatus Yaniella excrementigallinarum]|nr:beta-lactamase family protein [Candidatus Yaniella excrementigallinarum]
MKYAPELIQHSQALLEKRLASYPDVTEIGWVFIDANDVYPGPGQWRRFRIASMTKSFTAATALTVLQDHHNMSIETPLHEVLPELSPVLRDATIEHALTMTTGLPTDDAWADRLEAMSREAFIDLISQPLIVNQAPGVNYEYSNLGYAILGAVIEQVAGKPFEELLHDAVLDPLALDGSTLNASSASVQGMHQNVDGTLRPVEPTGPGAFSPIGGIWSTTTDIGCWMMHLRGARYRCLRGDVLASHDAILQAIQNPRVFYEASADAESVSYEGYGYGLHYRWNTELGEFLYHSGGYPGFGSHMRWHTQTGLGIAIMGNRTYFPGEMIAQPVLEELVRAVSYQPMQHREKAAPVATLPGLDASAETTLRSFFQLMESWEYNTAQQLFSSNVFQDYTRDEIRQKVEDLYHQQVSVDRWLSRTEVILQSRNSNRRIQILFNPLGEIQKLTWLAS